MLHIAEKPQHSVVQPATGNPWILAFTLIAFDMNHLGKTPSQSTYTPQGNSTPSLYVFSRYHQQSMLQNLLMSSPQNIQYDVIYDMRPKSGTGQGSWMLKFHVLQIHLANLPLELLLARCNMTHQPAAPEETAGVASGRV